MLVDIRMPDLDGFALTQVLDRFADPPPVAFVTAHERHALEAFEVGAVGYLLKPIEVERLERLLRRVVHPDQGQPEQLALETISLEHAGRTRIASRAEVVLVESAGDYVRVHLKDGSSHLLRMPISLLEQAWTEHGFVRVHRRYLVALREVSELRADESGTALVLAGRVIPVSRRHLRDLRDRLVGNARAGRR